MGRAPPICTMLHSPPPGLGSPQMHSTAQPPPPQGRIGGGHPPRGASQPPPSFNGGGHPPQRCREPPQGEGGGPQCAPRPPTGTPGGGPHAFPPPITVSPPNSRGVWGGDVRCNPPPTSSSGFPIETERIPPPKKMSPINVTNPREQPRCGEGGEGGHPPKIFPPPREFWGCGMGNGAPGGKTPWKIRRMIHRGEGGLVARRVPPPRRGGGGTLRSSHPPPPSPPPNVVVCVRVSPPRSPRSHRLAVVTRTGWRFAGAWHRRGCAVA